MRKETFKKMGKKLLGIGLALSMVLATPSVVVHAKVTHATGCKAVSTYAVCPSKTNSAGEVHFFRQTIYGSVYCHMTVSYGQHNVYCANRSCGVYLYTTNRVCKKDHEYCATEHGLCQR